MHTLRRLLQETDPIRHEASPNLEAARERLVSAGVRGTAAGPRVRARRRRPFLLAYVALSAVLLWAGWQGLPVTTPVAAQVRFEVRLAEDHPVPGLLVAEVGNSGQIVYLHPEALVGNDDIARTWVIEDDAPRFGVGVQLLSEAAERMRRLSAGHVGRPVAILIDGTVVMAPVVRSAISDTTVISGVFTRDAARRIAEGMERR